MLCRNISVLADDVVESMEDILLVLNTSDPAIVVTQPNVTVSIEDSSCKYFLTYMIQPVFLLDMFIAFPYIPRHDKM